MSGSACLGGPSAWAVSRPQGTVRLRDVAGHGGLLSLQTSMLGSLETLALTTWPLSFSFAAASVPPSGGGSLVRPGPRPQCSRSPLQHSLPWGSAWAPLLQSTPPRGIPFNLVWLGGRGGKAGSSPLLRYSSPRAWTFRSKSRKLCHKPPQSMTRVRERGKYKEKTGSLRKNKTKQDPTTASHSALFFRMCSGPSTQVSTGKGLLQEGSPGDPS